METLLDRINIEDFLTRYYYDLSNGKAHELSNYFTEDALLDVDGKWLISKRYISSDSGLPDRFDATWEARGNPLEE